MKISTGASRPLRDAMLEETTMSDTSKIADPRRSVFIELREKGTESVIARSALTLQKRSAQHRFRGHGYRLTPLDVRGPIAILSDAAIGDFVEVYIPPKESRLSVKVCKFHNCMTPYILTNGKIEEAIFEVPSFVVGTTLDLRRSFAKDVYDLALKSAEPIHKISALRAMEQLFIALAGAGKIPYEIAQKKFATYDALQSRMWRSNFPSEQLASFTAAWRMLAQLTNLASREDADVQS